MRTLSRPMFNMGGPIKQGIMHGIREPYRGGGAALVGNPVYPRTGGREHHAVVKEVIKRSGPIFGKVGNIFKGAPSKVTPKYPQTYTGKEYIPAPLTKMEQIKNWFSSAPAGKYLSGTPEAGIIKGLYEGKGMITKPIKWTATQAAKSPLVMAGLTYTGGKWLFGDGTEATDDQIKNIMKPGGYPPGKGKGTGTDTTTNAAAFAKAQREERLNKYLQMMGYDQSKKTAIADALIDASKIVSDRGTLDRKNITAELINPAIQALSKRLDKPEQIREAVGLMMTKAGLEKEMYDAKPGTIAKNVQDMVKSGKFSEEEAWAVATKGSQGAVADIQGAIATGKVGAGDWPAFVRATGAQHGEDVTVITAEEIKKDPEKYARFKDKSIMEIVEGSPDGIYVIGSETVRIKGGKKTQIR